MPKVITSTLYLITKLQNLKAIHNLSACVNICSDVVSNYKIIKSESYSQLYVYYAVDALGRI